MLWVFATAEAARAALPLMVGPTGPEKWDDPAPLGDGRWSITAVPDAPTPPGAELMLLGDLVRSGATIMRPLRSVD